jgi:hypothetical protein
MIRWALLFIVTVAVLLLVCTPAAAQLGTPFEDKPQAPQQPAVQGVPTPAVVVQPQVGYLAVTPRVYPGYGAAWARPGVLGTVVYRQRVWTGRPWVWRPWAPRYIPPPFPPAPPVVVSPGVLYYQATIQSP